MYADIAPRLGWESFSPAHRILHAAASRIAVGSLTATLPNGTEARYRGPAPGPAADIRVRRLRTFRRLLAGGGLGFAQSYLDGDWESDDPATLMELAARNHEALRQAIEGRPWVRTLSRILHRLRPNSKWGARRNIAAHYDLGNDFFALWLDRSMTYSAGVFAAPDDSLDAAQARKYARMAELADIRPEHTVLEIGCGWGGFCEWAAREIGCRMVGVTISEEQFDFAGARIAAAGLADRVEVRRQDYRDLEGQYDRIVSIEMLEAVGEAYWPVFFDILRRRLKPGGRAALQVITIDDAVFPTYRTGADFIQRHIFPGGMLPPPSALRAEVARAGLTWVEDSDHAGDYARTLAHWHRRFERAWPRIAALGFDERFRRLWRFYLAYCEAGFRSGRIGLMQMALSRPQTTPRPPHADHAETEAAAGAAR